MATKTISGNGTIASTDFKTVTWTGKTKGGQPIVITMNDAINLGNIDWTFAEKDDVVGSITFTSTYDNTDEASSSNAEPWSVSINSDQPSGAAEIVLGAGVFAIGGTDVALTRGGGKFTVTREYRRINADGDRGAVKGRIVMEGSEATLTMNVLTMLTNIANLYPALTVTPPPSPQTT